MCDRASRLAAVRKPGHGGSAVPGVCPVREGKAAVRAPTCRAGWHDPWWVTEGSGVRARATSRDQTKVGGLVQPNGRIPVVPASVKMAIAPSATPRASLRTNRRPA